MWVWALFAPHPPVIVPEVGGSRRHSAEKTLSGYECLRERLKPKLLSVDRLLILSPHFPYAEALVLDGSESYFGDLHSFGASSVAFSLAGDPQSARQIARHVSPVAKPHFTESEGCRLDHGSFVPLVMLRSLLHESLQVVLANPVGLSPQEAYRVGVRLRSYADNLRWGLLASGDLSHCLAPEGPYGYSPSGLSFEEAAELALRGSSPEPLFALSENTVTKAGQCGLNSMLLFLGLTGSLPVRLHSHEWPFGVGYLTASCLFGPLPTLLARRGLEHYFDYQSVLTREQAQEEVLLPRLWQEEGAAFVSIHTDQGALRGCIGTLCSCRPSLGEEIIANTLSAAFRDPRFKPVSREELASLRFSVDILSPSEPVVDRKDLDPHRWGIIVEDGARRGVLLPDLDGIDEVDQQIDIACRKAGIPEGRSLTISRFRVARFQEEP